MKVMVVILTSNQEQYAFRAYQSVLNQLPHSFDCDIFINVNSLDKTYIEKIRLVFKEESVTIIETESNGGPGKGHNSCLLLFKNHPKYDYAFFLDGDDMFYPCAFRQYEKLFQKSSDIDLVHLMINDNVTFEQKDLKHIKLIGNFYLYTAMEHQKNWWHEKKIANPFKEPLYKCRTPSRILITSRRIFTTSVPIAYCENCKLYDDYLVFLHFMEAQFKNELSTIALSDPTIYCYNAINFEGATRNFTSEKHRREQDIFNKSIEGKFLTIRDSWDESIKNMPWEFIEPLSEFPIQERPKFCNKQFAEFEINDKLKRASNALNEQDYEKAMFNYQLMDRFGASGKQMYMNWGKSLIECRLFEQAINVYERALSLPQMPHLNQEISTILTQLYMQEKFYPQAIDCLKGIPEHSENFKQYTQYISSSYQPIQFKESVKQIGTKPVLVFHTGFHSGQFNGENYQNRQAVYGSEIAVIRVAELLATEYNVFVFCQCDEEITFNNVHYQSITRFEDFQEKIQIDILVVSRFVNFFIHFTNSAKRTFFWVHDRRAHEMIANLRLTNIGRNLLTSLYPQIEKFITLTEWHKNWFIKESGMPITYQHKVCVIGNGIVESFFKNKHFVKTNRLIYCSDTTRGLEIALKCFPKIREKIPDVQLDIYFGSIPDNLKQIVDSMENVAFHGKIPQEQLCEELMKSKILFYPVFHHETYCIVATEAMRAGCIPVTVNKTGIGEVVDKYGITLPGDVKSTEWQEQAIQACINLLSNDDTRKKFQLQVEERGKTMTWDIRKQQWLNLFQQ